MIGLTDLVVLGLLLVVGGTLLLTLPALTPLLRATPRARTRRARHRLLRSRPPRHRAAAGTLTVRELRRRLYAEALGYRQAW
ncbi:MAG TPA: hypothetical protein VIL00_09470 [Pseudonocardiaceae bacterium]